MLVDYLGTSERNHFDFYPLISGPMNLGYRRTMSLDGCLEHIPQPRWHFTNTARNFHLFSSKFSDSFYSSKTNCFEMMGNKERATNSMSMDPSPHLVFCEMNSLVRVMCVECHQGRGGILKSTADSFGRSIRESKSPSRVSVLIRNKCHPLHDGRVPM